MVSVHSNDDPRAAVDEDSRHRQYRLAEPDALAAVSEVVVCPVSGQQNGQSEEVYDGEYANVDESGVLPVRLLREYAYDDGIAEKSAEDNQGLDIQVEEVGHTDLEEAGQRVVSPGSNTSAIVRLTSIHLPRHPMVGNEILNKS